MVSSEEMVEGCPMSGERALWGEVLVRGIADALWPNVTAGANQAVSGVTRYAQDDARAWFRKRDFNTVCHLAGFEPEFIRARVEHLIHAPASERHEFVRRMVGNYGRGGYVG